MTIGERIRDRRKELNLTVDDMTQRLNISRATFYRYESNEIEKLPATILEPLSKVLETTPSYLMGWDEQSSPNITEDYTTFPVIGDIAAGFDHIAAEDWTGETIDVPNTYLKGRKSSDFFVLCVKGNSMFPTYQENDKVLVLRQNTVNYSGQVGAVIYDDECATLKKIEYKQGEDWMKLVPINPTYPTVFIENERLEHCRVLGIPQFLLREINER